MDFPLSSIDTHWHFAWSSRRTKAKSSKMGVRHVFSLFLLGWTLSVYRFVGCSLFARSFSKVKNWCIFVSLQLPNDGPARFGNPVGSSYPPPPSSDPYSQHPEHEPLGGPGGPQVILSNCKRPGCPNPVRMMSNSGRPMPEYCSNDCLVEDNNKQLTNNPYANAAANWNPQPQEGANQQPPNNNPRASPTSPSQNEK